MKGRLLIVDDEQAVCWSLERVFRKEGLEVAVAGSAEEALRKAGEFQPDAALIDLRLPGRDGLHLLSELRTLRPDVAAVIMTAHGKLRQVVDAMQAGAADYLYKPFDVDQAVATVMRHLHRPDPQAAAQDEADDGDEVVGSSPAMREVFKRIAIAAGNDAPVLITGETGVGKDLVARAIHRHSPRKERPFVPVHLASLNEALAESELFGRTRGAYTGAAESKPGLLELAEGGTVFLDEIGEAPASLQTKLLRAVEQREILPVGGTSAIAVDFRIVSATNRDLRAAIDAGGFRADLYYRLNAFEIHVPPLRSRSEDIPELARHFLRLAEYPSPRIPETTIDFLVRRRWPGNVRELRHALSHASALARGAPILPEHFPKDATALAAESIGAGTSAAESRLAAAVREWLIGRLTEEGDGELHRELAAEVERTLIAEALAASKGNRAAAARKLGLDRTTLRKKIAAFGLGDAADEN